VGINKSEKGTTIHPKPRKYVIRKGGMLIADGHGLGTRTKNGSQKKESGNRGGIYKAGGFNYGDAACPGKDNSAKASASRMLRKNGFCRGNKPITNSKGNNFMRPGGTSGTWQYAQGREPMIGPRESRKKTDCIE